MTATDHVSAAYAAIARADRPEVWITLRPLAEVREEVAATDSSLPLAGYLLAVKDNIDVAGLPTTAACPAYAYSPSEDAPAVARLRAAGAVVLGKTNLDHGCPKSRAGQVSDVPRHSNPVCQVEPRETAVEISSNGFRTRRGAGRCACQLRGSASVRY